MAKTRLSEKALYVTYGYGQVEPNHMSAQRTGQIYAQLPAAANIAILENGQFVKYNYAKEVVDFGTGANDPTEWMLVFNEVKVYRDGQSDADFAMIRDNYAARIYSPIDGTQTQTLTAPRFYGGVDAQGHEIRVDENGMPVAYDAEAYATATPVRPAVTPADPYEWDSTANPFASAWTYGGPKKMPAGTVMVPRVFKTNVGDIFTTNTIAEAPGSLAINDLLTPGADGYLAKAGASNAAMKWQVVKVYDLGDRQPAVKLLRIQ